MFDTIITKLTHSEVVDTALNVLYNNYTFRFKDDNKIRIEFDGWSRYTILVNGAVVIHEANYFRKRRLYKLIQKLLKDELQKELFCEKDEKP